MTKLFDTQTTDEFGNTYSIGIYCECAESIADKIDNRWFCEECGGYEIDYGPDADLLTEQYFEDQQELL